MRLKSDNQWSVDRCLVYTPQQIADVLMVSRSTVYSLLQRDIIPSIKIGRCRRIPRRAFHRFVDELVGNADRGDHLDTLP